jgi:hypothetical protein
MQPKRPFATAQLPHLDQFEAYWKGLFNVPQPRLFSDVMFPSYLRDANKLPWNQIMGLARRALPNLASSKAPGQTTCSPNTSRPQRM